MENSTRFDVNRINSNASFWHCVIEPYVTNIRQRAITHHILLSSLSFSNHGSSFGTPSQTRIKKSLVIVSFHIDSDLIEELGVDFESLMLLPPLYD